VRRKGNRLAVDAAEERRSVSELVFARGGGAPTARLDRALGFGRDSEPLREPIALACAKGWIARVEGRGFIPGATVPTPDQGPAATSPAKPELPHRERSQEPAAERYEVMASAIKAMSKRMAASAMPTLQPRSG
jgi:hypothetical protein